MIDFDFLPPDFHRRRGERRTLRRCVLLGVVMISVMFGWVLTHVAAQRRADRITADVSRQRMQVQIHRVKLQMLMEERDSLVAYERLRGRLEDEASLAVILAAATERWPAGVALRELIYDRTGTTTQPVTPYDAVPRGTTTAPGESLPLLKLCGIGNDVTGISDLAAALAGHRYFTEVATRTAPEARHGEVMGLSFEMSARALPHAEGPR